MEAIKKELGETDLKDEVIGDYLERISNLKCDGKLKNKLVILPWTDEEINIVLDLRAKGLSINKIAIELGRSYGSVMWKERELRKENCG